MYRCEQRQDKAKPEERHKKGTVSVMEGTNDACENTWKCGELKLYFSPSAGGLKKNKNKTNVVTVFELALSLSRELKDTSASAGLRMQLS